MAIVSRLRGVYKGRPQCLAQGPSALAPNRMRSFSYNQLPGRVVFGVGALDHLQREIELLGASHALVLSTPEQRAQAQDIADRLGGRCVGIFPRAVMHVPVETAREARAEASRLGADCAVAIGGGSTTGLGKAIALESALPILAIPTTYAGSEMTPIYGITEGGMKKTGRDRNVLPRTVIYDPALTVGLPVGLSVTSGFNAIAHAVEALYAQDSNPISSLMAEDGIRALAQGLPRVVENASDLDARGDCLYGAWLCGAVLGAVGMALHHKLCHVLGGTWNLPHAQTHTVILPHAVAYNYQAAPDAMRRVERALDAPQAAQGIYDLMKRLGAPLALKDIGMREAELDRAADLATQAPYFNPRSPDRAGIRELLDAAFHGRRPQ
jgi:maleylacetate reductase